MNDHLRTLLRRIYRVHSALRVVHNHHVEAWLEISDLGQTVINESSHDDAGEFATLFSGVGRGQFMRAFHDLRLSLNGKPFRDCDREIAALAFVQFVAARAMWEHHIDVDSELDRFVRQFDRLDDPSERERLHQECQIEADGPPRTLN